jgi:hypothetical protein
VGTSSRSCLLPTGWHRRNGGKFVQKSNVTGEDPIGLIVNLRAVSRKACPSMRGGCEHHAASVRPSSDFKHHASRPQEAQIASQVSYQHHLSRADVHQMVLHRPVECTRPTRHVLYDFLGIHSSHSINGIGAVRKANQMRATRARAALSSRLQDGNDMGHRNNREGGVACCQTVRG